MAITRKQYEDAIAIINAFNAGKEKPMKKSAPVKDIVSVLTDAELKLSRVTATTAGKTGFGVEFEVADMHKKADLPTKTYKEIRAIYNYMKADFEEVDGEMVRTRNCFFYLGFPTKAKRDAEVKRLSAFLVEEKPAPKKASTKKTEPKKADAKKSAPKSKGKKADAPAPSVKETLLASIGTMSFEEKKALIAALFA